MNAVYDLFYKESNTKLKKNIYQYWVQTPNKKEPRLETTNSAYKIVSYDKSMLCFDESIGIRQYRSVIYSHPENNLLSFSPPRAISLYLFRNTYDTLTEDIQISEFIEGILIHMFYDFRIGSWEIATKNAIGGNYSIVQPDKKKTKDTIRTMFLEALRFTKDTQLTCFDTFPKFHSFTFVLQHPSNKILLSVPVPALYVVAVYEISETDKFAEFIPQSQYSSWKCFCDIPTILFPKQYSFSTYEQCIQSLEKLEQFSSMGLNITNIQTGERTRIFNEIYESVYKNKRMSSDLHYLYLCLHHSKKVKCFLRYFSPYKKMFFKFYEQYKELVKTIHSSYLEKYVYKTIKNNERYVRYIDRLHKEIYIPSLSSGNKIKITKAVIYQFLNTLEPEEVLYILNENRRRISL